MRRMLLALLSAILVSVAPAQAGRGERGDWELGVYGGFGWLDDFGLFHPADDMLYGARLGYFITPTFSMEVSGQRLPTETEFDATEWPLGLTPANTDVKLDAIRLNGIYNFAPGASVRPFLTAGVGYEIVDIDGFDGSENFGWNAGAGLRFFLSPNWSIRTEGRFVQFDAGEDVDDSTQEDIEATVGLSVMFGGGGGEAAPAAEVVNQAPTVTCASDRAEILPGENVRIVATASDPEGEALTYQWSTTAGRVTGTGNSATLDFTGATPPATATVTVRVSDARGNTASSDCAVRLLEPVRPAESVSCLAGGFPRNLSRITNVDKACLDDVAQRLKADPRARVIVMGHADSRETNPELVAEQRATAVKDYLVAAGIEASRITTRTLAATRPLETGADASAQAQNRRVEVWFVPEGAKEPE